MNETNSWVRADPLTRPLTPAPSTWEKAIALFVVKNASNPEPLNVSLSASEEIVKFETNLGRLGTTLATVNVAEDQVAETVTAAFICPLFTGERCVKDTTSCVRVVGSPTVLLDNALTVATEGSSPTKTFLVELNASKPVPTTVNFAVSDDSDAFLPLTNGFAAATEPTTTPGIFDQVPATAT